MFVEFDNTFSVLLECSVIATGCPFFVLHGGPLSFILLYSCIIEWPNAINVGH